MEVYYSSKVESENPSLTQITLAHGSSNEVAKLQLVCSVEIRFSYLILVFKISRLICESPCLCLFAGFCAKEDKRIF